MNQRNSWSRCASLCFIISVIKIMNPLYLNTETVSENWHNGLLEIVKLVFYWRQDPSCGPKINLNHHKLWENVREIGLSHKIQFLLNVFHIFLLKYCTEVRILFNFPAVSLNASRQLRFTSWYTVKQICSFIQFYFD